MTTVRAGQEDGVSNSRWEPRVFPLFPQEQAPMKSNVPFSHWHLGCWFTPCQLDAHINCGNLEGRGSNACASFTEKVSYKHFPWLQSPLGRSCTVHSLDVWVQCSLTLGCLLFPTESTRQPTHSPQTTALALHVLHNTQMLSLQILLNYPIKYQETLCHNWWSHSGEWVFSYCLERNISEN